MNKRTIDEDVYDRYVEATVALFMEYYSSVSLPENIRAELNSLEDENFVFPIELDNRCRALIKKECTRHRRKQYLRGVTKGLRYVAVLAVALLSLSSFLFMTVEAFRIPIINYFIEQNDGYWEIFGQKDSNQDISDDIIDATDPLANLIPEEYQLAVLEGDSIAELTAIYANSDGKRIYFSAMPGDSWTAIDSEDAQVSKECEIGGCSAILVVDNPYVRILWIDDSTSTVYMLIADEMEETEAVSIVEKLIYKISK